MLNVRVKPQARPMGSRGFDATANDSDGNPFVTRTPGSGHGSAFQPVSPAKIDGGVREDDSNVLDLLCKNSYAKYGKSILGSPCDKTAAMSLQSLDTLPSEKERQKKDGIGWAAANATMKSQIKQMKMNIPKAMKSMKVGTSRKSAVDLADLAVATICVVPRHGAGIAVGRMPFERVRTSLMMHMIHETRNSPCPDDAGDDVTGEASKKGKAQIVKLNALLRKCIADEGSCFVEKAQEAVKLAKNALEELNANGKSSLAKNDLGRRNLTCVKFLSGMYRDVIKDERDVPSRDGLSLMVVASAYYAIGKFEPALSVLQRAGIELGKKISTSPEYTVFCAKLFNNMGCVYFEMGKYEKAMQTFQRALQLFHNDDECNYTAWVAAILDQSSIMNNMAYTLIKFKQYDDASDLVDTSFELQQMLPEKSDKTMLISTLSTMAFIYYRTKKYKQSLDTYTGKKISFHR
ncbi:hypothetical protein ACHAW5_010039 [Stephanodiscus triporus]|uniref:Uncharacterized protein n=1 Tax=Stephanodiscus triporus TaxID=2934178 RepID=A0ABD3QMS5_9STRA